MKTTYVDPTTGERHILVRIASSAVATLEAGQADQQELLRLVLDNQLVIMRALEDVAKPHVRDALQEHRKTTEERLARLAAPLEVAA